jgi:hypothetical protein
MPQEAQACLMGVILDVTRNQQGAGIAQQHLSGRGSEARISSARFGSGSASNDG